MQIAELYQHRQFRLTDGPTTDPAPGEVQVKVRSIGICGSDIHYFSDGGIGEIHAPFPVVLGHEPTGNVVKTGAGVTGWQPGDAAILEPAVYCYHCEFCRSGRHNVCAEMKFLSSAGEPGFFREFVNLPAHNLLPLPAGLDMETGTLFEPLAIVLHSLRLGTPALGETVAVFGTGPIGLLTISVLKSSGVGRIWAVEPVAGRREMAKAMGAAVVLDPHEGDVIKQILSDTSGRGVDLAFDCAAKDDTTNDAIAVTRSAGRVVLTGIHSEVRVPMRVHELRRKELVLYNVRRSNHETELALEMMRDLPGRFAPLITHRQPIDTIQSAFEMLETGGGGAAKVVLQFR